MSKIKNVTNDEVFKAVIDSLAVKSMCYLVSNVDNMDAEERTHIDVVAMMEICEELMERIYDLLSRINTEM